MAYVIFLLCAVMLILLFAVSGVKGFRSVISFALTIIILLAAVIPLIAHGYNPVWVIVVCGLPLIALVVYLTEGFGKIAHISILAIIFNFIITSGLAYWGVRAAQLTGLVSDESSSVGSTGIHLPALLAAGIMLGTLGMLAEMVVTQVATVMEFSEADPKTPSSTIFKQSYSVGIAHLGSIINTLFLVYAGISLPLLILFVSGGSSLASTLNYEPLATEIIRTLIGTIGLIIAMPTSTIFAVWWMRKKNKKAQDALL
jgi:uncharacterized membrane protein